MTTRGIEVTRSQTTPAATNASAASPKKSVVDLKQLKDELTCSICLEVCIRPCSTPCGHSFCRGCLREALRHSPKCPKCRDILEPGFSLTVNVVLWNTIQMLFPNTEEAPASPPASPTPHIRTTDGRHLRHIVSLEAEARRRLRMNRAYRGSISELHAPSRNHTGDFHSSHRRRRLSSATSDDDGVEEIAIRGQPATSFMRRAHYSDGGREIRYEDQITPRRTVRESPELRHFSHQYAAFGTNTNASSASLMTDVLLTTPPTAVTNDSIAREDNHVHETFSSSSRHPWIRRSRRGFSGIRNGHGIGVANSLNRSASHGDLHHSHHLENRITSDMENMHDDIEYVTVQRVQRLDRVPSHRLRGVHRIEPYNRDRVIQHFQRTGIPMEGSGEAEEDGRETELAIEDPEFDEENFETASDIISDRDSSFTSSIAAAGAFPGSHVNSFRFHHQHHHQEEVAASPASYSVEPPVVNSASTGVSIAGDERLYDISSQIRAAMNDIVRLNMAAEITRHVDGTTATTTHSQPSATPLTHRSCFQLSDEEEEEGDWNARIRDAVFILDDEDETESEDDVAPAPTTTTTRPSSPFDDFDEISPSMYRMTDPSQWLSSVEDQFYSYY